MLDYLTFEESEYYRILFRSGAVVDNIEIVYSILEKALDTDNEKIVVEIAKVEETDWFFLQLVVSFGKSLETKGKKLCLKSDEMECLDEILGSSGFEHLFSFADGCYHFSEGY